MSSLGSLATETLSVTRYTSGQWTAGRFVKGPPSGFSFRASVQPLTANEIAILPEHRRNSESLKVYTETRLFNPDEKNGIPGDVITHDGKRYEVHKVSNWEIGTGIPHFKAICIMIDGEGSGGRD